MIVMREIQRAKTAEVEAMRDLNNYKPYRSAEQKAEARRTARQKSGTWVSDAPVKFHPIRKDLLGRKAK